MEVARPHERQHVASEAPDEAHQRCEVRHEYSDKHREPNEGESQEERPHLHTVVGVETRADGRLDSLATVARCLFAGFVVSPSVSEERVLEELDSGEVRQRIGEESLGDEAGVDDDPHRRVWQVVGDHLGGRQAPREEAHVGEHHLEDGGRKVRPVHHAVEPVALLHVSLERRQEDLRRIAEYDDAERDGERPDVDAHLHGAPVPLGSTRHAVRDDDGVNRQVRHCAPEAEEGDVP